MSAQPAEKTLKEELQDTRNELWRLADEIRVKIHLAGMEVKETWSKLEPRLHDFEGRIEGAAETIGTELKDVSIDLKDRLKKIRDEL